VNNNIKEVKSNTDVNSLNMAIRDTLYSRNLDLLLSCDKYAYFEDKKSFAIPYNGCVYNSDSNNKIGWAYVYLIVNKKKNRLYRDFSSKYLQRKEDEVNSMSIDRLKADFIPFVFLIEKKYLKFVKDAEIQYYPSLPYTRKLLEYRKQNNEWILLDTLNVLEEIQDDKWMDSKLTEKLDSEE